MTPVFIGENVAESVDGYFPDVWIAFQGVFRKEAAVRVIIAIEVDGARAERTEETKAFNGF